MISENKLSINDRENIYKKRFYVRMITIKIKF